MILYGVQRLDLKIIIKRFLESEILFKFFIFVFVHMWDEPAIAPDDQHRFLEWAMKPWTIADF